MFILQGRSNLYGIGSSTTPFLQLYCLRIVIFAIFVFYDGAFFLDSVWMIDSMADFVCEGYRTLNCFSNDRLILPNVPLPILLLRKPRLLGARFSFSFHSLSRRPLHTTHPFGVSEGK